VRTIIFVSAALLLAACETEDGWVPGESPAPVQRTAPAAASIPAPVVAPAPVAEISPFVAPQPVAPAPVAAPDVTAAETPSPYDAHCKAVAHQRAADARANGYSFDMADAVYNGTYKDCVTWDRQHGPDTSE